MNYYDNKECNIVNSDTCILISSCDKYSDTWNPFFSLFFKYYPNCKYPIYLLSNNINFKHINVNALSVGNLGNWSDELKIALTLIPESYIIYFQDDYFLMEYVNTNLLDRLVKISNENKLDYLRLFPHPGPGPDTLSEIQGIGLITKNGALSFRTSLQVSIWNRKVFIDLLKPNENPWEFEIYGSIRSRKYRFFCVNQDMDYAIIYYCTAIRKGKWERNAVDLCSKEGIIIDFSLRKVESKFYKYFKETIYDNVPVRYQKYLWYLMHQKKFGNSLKW